MSTTKDLLKAGMLNEGDTLIWKRRVQGITHEARVHRDGTIETSDGKKHKTQSGAAKHLNSDKPVDGWIAWRLKNSGEQLSTLRAKLSSSPS